MQLCRGASGDRVFLAPVAELLQLRPSLEHLDAARPQPRAPEPVKEEEKPALTAVSVRPRLPAVQAAGCLAAAGAWPPWAACGARRCTCSAGRRTASASSGRAAMRTSPRASARSPGSHCRRAVAGCGPLETLHAQALRMPLTMRICKNAYLLHGCLRPVRRALSLTSS